MMKYTFKAILTTTALSFPVAFVANIFKGDRPGASPIMTEEQIAFDAKFLKELLTISDIEGPEPGQHNW
jgi:hypothetical protein